MDNGIEGIGTAIAGGLVARAVEPGHGEGGADGETICANCSTPLLGTHCHFCGQKAHVHRSIAAIGHDLIHGVLHLDGKFWRTLPKLVIRPGELTRRYAQGERAKFVSPLGMFLFSIFMMFAVLSIFNISLANIEVGATTSEAIQSQAGERLEDARAHRERLAAMPPTEELVAEIEQIDLVISGIESGMERLENNGDNGLPFTIMNGGTGWSRLDSGLEKISENPTLALYKLQANGYKFSWLLIPISVPFVWLLFFWTRRFRMYDHTVFVTYSLAFMSLFAVALILIGVSGMSAPWIPIAALVVPPVHIFSQLKGAYSLHWLTALLRTFLLAGFCFLTAMIFFILLMGIGALG